MAYNTPETVADYLARFQMEITHRGKGTFTPDHVKYSLTIASGGKDFFTTFESNPHVHGEPTITQVFGALASDAMVVRDYGMDEFVDEFCDGMKPSAAIRAYNSCKETYDWMRDGLYLSNGDIASLSEVISENEEEIGALVEKAASERAARYAYDHPKLPKGFVTSSSTTSITARNSAPPLVTWNSPSDALLRNTRKRKGRSLTTSPPANGVCILSTPESVTVSMVA